MRSVVAPIALAAILLTAAWLVPGLVSEAVLADWMLQQSYKLPELVSAYVPDLLRAVRFSLLSGVFVPLAVYAAWTLILRLRRPTGPSQVGQGWRRNIWIISGITTAVVTFVLAFWAELGNLETVDGTAAHWLSFLCAATALLVFWLLSLLGTEPMMLPAVPIVARLGRQS